jgi:hypothetical protein
MTADDERLSPEWLALREPADAAARAAELAERVADLVPHSRRWVIHDLGCGTGSMGRWLAPRLAGAQHWVVHDRDPDLLAVAAATPPPAAADGAAVTVEPRQTDLAAVGVPDLAGADLLTASALLDLLTPDELRRLLAACLGAGCPVLLTLSVVGQVELAPADPLDARVGAAFNAHQRRPTARGPLLGPDAVEATVAEAARFGCEAVVRPSPWRLGATEAALTAAWFTGWIGAAVEQEPALLEDGEGYAERRLDEAGEGRLAATVGHADVLLLPAVRGEGR